MGRHGEKRDAISVITGTRHGGPVAGRDPGPWAFTWLAGGNASLLAVGGLLPGGSWWPPLAALGGCLALAARAVLLTRSDGWAARRELLGVLRALGAIEEDGTALLNRDAHLVHVVEVKNVRALPWPFPWRWQKVTVTELAEGYLAAAAAAGSGHLTGRTFTLVPWESGVRVTVRDATFRAGGGEAEQMAFFRQWYPDERTMTGRVRADWRGWRSGALHAPPAEARVLAGMLAAAENIDREAPEGEK
jgi:hypothetical protein